MNHLNKRRDELAEIRRSISSRENGLDVYESSIVEYEFKKGFDAAISGLKPEIDRLLDTLFSISTAKLFCDNSEILKAEAEKALQRWREFNGDE